MKIVILDGYTANPGDYSWKELNTFGEVEIYDRTSPNEVIERAKDADMILTNKVVLKATHSHSYPNSNILAFLPLVITSSMLTKRAPAALLYLTFLHTAPTVLHK